MSEFDEDFKEDFVHDFDEDEPPTDPVKCIAIAHFLLAAMDYVKEMDSDLWERATDFAKHHHGMDGVKFDLRNDDEEKGNQD